MCIRDSEKVRQRHRNRNTETELEEKKGGVRAEGRMEVREQQGVGDKSHRQIHGPGVGQVSRTRSPSPVSGVWLTSYWPTAPLS